MILSTMVNHSPSQEIILQGFKKNKHQYRQKLKFLKQKNPSNLDMLFLNAHEEVFKTFDCLDCARCCKFLGPRIIQRDILRLSKELKINSRDFILQYLRIDEDGDYVFKSMPCPFLMDDNCCMVYGKHPKACQDYPHTDSRKMKSRLNALLKDCEICPAAVIILDKILGEIL
ncbi:MAG: YkgJ family cysteine cluster protein [Spirochaetaceae bacterium]|jgi:Fe-S-cluster containining protein|nr:YkgJ family cysteine cluster protein [Spirochaetaceae bacterium]